MLPFNKNYTLRQFIKMSRLRLILLLVIGLVLILSGLFTLLWVPRVSTYQIRMTGGIKILNRHKVAEYLERHSKELNLDIDLVTCEGTPEAVAMIQSGEIDLALVNGLLHLPKANNVRQVATLAIEPVHLVVKQEYAKRVAEDFANLNGLSVDAGPKDAESTYLTSAILKFLQIKSVEDGPDGVRLTDVGIDNLFIRLDQMRSAPVAEKAKLRATLPDAMFHDSTLPSPLVKRVIQEADYELVPLPFAPAFALINVEEQELDRDHIDQSHVEPVVIPAYTYGGTPPQPARDCHTLGAPLILIAHKDVPNEVITRLLPRLYSGPIGRLFDPPELKTLTPTYPLHPASVAYRDRDQPLLRADVMDFIRQIFSVIAPLVGGCLALYSYYRWRQTLRFLDYFRQLQRFDLIAKGLLTDDTLPPEGPERERHLELELEKLQRKAVDDFCRNYFYREGVLYNFLSVMAETRDFLRRPELKALPEKSDTPQE